MRLIAIALLALALLPARAAATDRLDTLAAQLRERPVAVDRELSWFLPEAPRERLERVLKDAPVPVFVAVLPLLSSDESAGSGDRVADALRRRVGRPGLYLVTSDDGYLDAAADRFPRRVRVTYGLPDPPRGEVDVAEVVGRIGRLVDALAAAAPGETTTERAFEPLKPYEDPYGRGRQPGPSDGTGSAMLASVLVGGTVGLLLGGVARVGGGRARRCEREHAAKPFWRRWGR